jgi:uncharacterized membrane protein
VPVNSDVIPTQFAAPFRPRPCVKLGARVNHVAPIEARKMQKKDYVQAAVVALLAAALTSLLSLTADYKVGPKEFGLFPRSGGLLALAAAVLEYQLWVRLYLRNSYKPGTPVSLGGLAESANLPTSEQRLKNLAHSCVAVGTLIWAYGDLLYRWM